MNEAYTCAYCGHESNEEGRDRCECGVWYCRLHCVIKGLEEVGIYQYTWDEIDKCGSCALEKLKQGKLTFPQGDKDIRRHLAPHLLLHVIEAVKPVKRKKKVCEGQISLF